jgi:putative transposase
MVHAPRIEYPGAIHHVTSRGASRTAICHTDADYAALVGSVAAATRIANWRCLAYCVMPNHYHLLIQTPVPTLSVGMHRLNGMYASRYNTTYEHTGHVFQGRFHAELVRSDEHLLEALRYIALNPVRGMLARSPERWRWSSYRATAGWCASPPWVASGQVLGLMGSDLPDSRRRYREFVGAVRTAPTRRPALAVLVTSTRRSDIVAAREHGYTQSEIAAHLGVSQPTVSRILSQPPN